MITLNRLRTWMLFLTSVFMLSACVENGMEQKHDPLPASTVFPCQIDGQTVRIELALNLTEMRKGLMYRNELPENRGMLFCYETPDQLSFWMRNTLIPLEIGYFDSTGTLLEIYEMYPRDESPVESISENIQFALEVNKGWFEEHKITPGAKLEMATVISAIMARGYDPSDYNL